jgi:L-ribulokinase
MPPPIHGEKFVIGIDFGTDSVRSVLTGTSGRSIAESVHRYSRWNDGAFCDSTQNRFRQHPLDYLEGLTHTIKEVLDQAGEAVRKNVAAISADTTGSTPVAVDRTGKPLALAEEFSENPNAMFILWKDHTAIREAAEINEIAGKSEPDYTKYVGGIYSSEWFWAKILHTMRADEQVRKHGFSWVEHCDWIPFELTGGTDVTKMIRSRCAAGHKAMWHEEFGGLPSQQFLSRLDPLLDGIRDRMYRHTYTADHPAGTLSAYWSEKLGLGRDVVVGTGAFDAHMGAVGGQIEPWHLSRVMGTSTCDMLIAPPEEIGNRLVRGICGQVDGSVVPGMIGLEAGQSAFGDTFAWFKEILMWPVKTALENSEVIDAPTQKKLMDELDSTLLKRLEQAAVQSSMKSAGDDLIALDWLNGRRTPDADQNLTSAIEGLSLGTKAPDMYRALAEAICFGARSIVDRFTDEGIPIRGVIGMGGVAKKSPFVMQTLSDVLDMPIRIVNSEHTCALGAGMFAATAAGLFPNVQEAAAAMGSGFSETYSPDPESAGKYRLKYERFRSLARIVEKRVSTNRSEQII